MLSSTQAFKEICILHLASVCNYVAFDRSRNIPVGKDVKAQRTLKSDHHTNLIAPSKRTLMLKGKIVPREDLPRHDRLL